MGKLDELKIRFRDMVEIFWIETMRKELKKRDEREKKESRK
jgi:hypothetical protein